jgi:hypothetical protein
VGVGVGVGVGGGVGGGNRPAIRVSGKSSGYRSHQGEGETTMSESRERTTSKRPRRNVTAGDLGLISKHTPGPWVVGTMGHDTDMETQINCLREGVDTEREWTSIHLNVTDGDAPDEVVALTHPDNAHLIAAAPELLEACKHVVQRYCGCHSSSDRNWHGKDCSVPLLKAAIAKAEGRE